MEDWVTWQWHSDARGQHKLQWQGWTRVTWLTTPTPLAAYRPGHNNACQLSCTCTCVCTVAPGGQQTARTHVHSLTHSHTHNHKHPVFSASVLAWPGRKTTWPGAVFDCGIVQYINRNHLLFTRDNTVTLPFPSCHNVPQIACLKLRLASWYFSSYYFPDYFSFWNPFLWAK